MELADNIDRGIISGISSGHKTHCKINSIYYISRASPWLFLLFVMIILFLWGNLLGKEKEEALLDVRNRTAHFSDCINLLCVHNSCRQAWGCSCKSHSCKLQPSFSIREHKQKTENLIKASNKAYLSLIAGKKHRERHQSTFSEPYILQWPIHAERIQNWSRSWIDSPNGNTDSFNFKLACTMGKYVSRLASNALKVMQTFTRRRLQLEGHLLE